MMQNAKRLSMAAVAVWLPLLSRTAARTAPAAQASTATAPASMTYPITGLDIAYKSPRPDLPSIADLEKTQIELGVAGGCYVAPQDNVPREKVTLGDIGKGEVQRIDASAIRTLYNHIISFLNGHDLIGVFVMVDAADIGPDDRDLRAGRTRLTMTVSYSTVVEIRTINLLREPAKVNAPEDAGIRDNCPIKPAAAGGPDLLNKKVLDAYVLSLDEKLGKRIDVAVSGTGERGKVALDFMISRTPGTKPATTSTAPSR